MAGRSQKQRKLAEALPLHLTNLTQAYFFSYTIFSLLDNLSSILPH